MSTPLVYVGVKAHVAAVDAATGRTVWQTKLASSALSGDRFVTLLVAGDRVFAHTYGTLHCLDAASGRLLWQNLLPGLGYDVASVAMNGHSAGPTAEIVRRKREGDDAAVAAS